MLNGYRIIVDMLTTEGYVEYCRFFAGEDKETAESLFDALLGIDTEDDTYILRMSLADTNSTLPNILAMRYCKLTELTENCRIITRDIFKYFNME